MQPNAITFHQDKRQKLIRLSLKFYQKQFKYLSQVTRHVCAKSIDINVHILPCVYETLYRQQVRIIASSLVHNFGFSSISSALFK